MVKGVSAMDEIKGIRSTGDAKVLCAKYICELRKACRENDRKTEEEMRRRIELLDLYAAKHGYRLGNGKLSSLLMIELYSAG